MDYSHKEIKDYYDKHVVGKLSGFTDSNRRVEAAYDLVKKHIQPDTKSILEVGCGIGDVSYRFSKHFPSKKIVGIDISEKSIEVAKKLFQNPNLSYYCGDMGELALKEQFDLIIMIDVYEHIPADIRDEFNTNLSKLLSKNGTLIATFPTPEHQGFLRAKEPEKLQPIDEDITIDVINSLLKKTNCDIFYYEKKSIWFKHDYAHLVIKNNFIFDKSPLPITALARGLRLIKKFYFFVRSFSRKNYAAKKMR